MPKTDGTQRAIELFDLDPSLYLDFMAEIGDHPLNYGIEMEDLATLTSSAVGRPLALFISNLVHSLDPGWAELDAASVDWARVSDVVAAKYFELDQAPARDLQQER